MENPEVANTSTKTEKKKKSKNKSSNESILHMEANVKPRRSFWRSLFKKQPKKIEDESRETVITPKLNAIFEEPKSSEDKDAIQDEIEEFKQTLKQISPSILESDPPQNPPPIAKTSQEGLLEFLSSASSTSETSAASEKVTIEPIPSEGVKDKDAYSFEYSESSETSGEGAVEEKTQDKVKFVETVEQKDADSNIVVKELNPGEDEATGTEEESEPQQQPINTAINPAGSEINASEDNNLDPSEDMTKFPDLPSVPVAEQPPNKVLQHKRSPEMPLPDTDSDRKSLDEKSTGSQESSETEVWSERLNELSGLSKSVLPTAVDVNSLDETASGYREYRLDDFFKMVLQTNDEQIIKYSVAYDPIFANFNFEYFPQNLVENETFPTDDKQKVVRKRKMMSLLHDKNKMAEYLREIEQKENDKLISEEKTMDYMINLNNCTSVTAPQNSPKQKEKNMQIPPENQNEKILYLLENTKEKLQKHIEHNNNNIDPKILNLYPENYLNMFKSEIFLELPNKKMDQSTPNIQEIKDNQPLTNDSQTELPIAAISQKNIEKKFDNIEKEIDMLFKDLLANITELKDACIINGCPVDQSESNEPLVTMKPLIETTIVKPILDEILENVFQKDSMLKGNFNSKPLSFISDFGEFINEPANLQISQPFQTFTVPKITLEQNLEQNEKILNALHEEIFEYNPVSYINSGEYTPIPSENSQNNETPDTNPVNLDLIEKQEIFNAIHDEIFESSPVSHKNSPEYTPEMSKNKFETPNSGPVNKNLTEKQLLNEIHDEIFESSPVSYINSPEYTPISSEDSQNILETPNYGPVNQNLNKQVFKTIHNEIFESNPVSLINSPEYTPISSEDSQNILETPNSGSVNQNFTKQVFITIHDEIFESCPVSYINSPEYTPISSEDSQNIPNSNPDNLNILKKQEISENLIENIISNAVQNIEQETKELEKSKKFGLFHEKKVVDLPFTPRITNFNCNNPPDVTESLKHIFFGEEPDMSDFNLIQENSPQAGPSNQETDIPQLPSVPSTPLEGSNSEGSSAGRLITILDNKFTEGTELSTMAYPLDNLSHLDLNYNTASISSEYCKKDLELERKTPEINFFEPKMTEGDSISKSIQDNLKLFQQNMIKINNTNQKTVDMLNNPSLETPEGSLSILSTIHENLDSVDAVSKISKISKNSENSQNTDRYPQFIANKDPKTNAENPKDDPKK